MRHLAILFSILALISILFIGCTIEQDEEGTYTVEVQDNSDGTATIEVEDETTDDNVTTTTTTTVIVSTNTDTDDNTTATLNDDNTTVTLDDNTTAVIVNYDYDLKDYFVIDNNFTATFDVLEDSFVVPNSTAINMYSYVQDSNSSLDTDFVLDRPFVNTHTATYDDNNVTITDSSGTHSYVRHANNNTYINAQCKITNYYQELAFTADYDYHHVLAVLCIDDDSNHDFYYFERWKGLGAVYRFDGVTTKKWYYMGREL